MVVTDRSYSNFMNSHAILIACLVLLTRLTISIHNKTGKIEIQA